MTPAELLGKLTDGRPLQFLKLLKERAKELCPDYPWVKEDAFEYLWAICSSLEGVRLACDDLHGEIARLRAANDRLRSELTTYKED